MHYSQGRDSFITSEGAYKRKKFLFDKEFRDKAMMLNYKYVIQQKPAMENHILASEVIMGKLYDYFISQGRVIKQSKDEWVAAGLLHDADHLIDTIEEIHGLKIKELMAKEGIFISPDMMKCISSHDGVNTPESLMDWSLYCSDDISWLVLHAAKKRADRNIFNVTVDDVLSHLRLIKGGDEVYEKIIVQNKKTLSESEDMKGHKLYEIMQCEDRLRIDLEDFIQIIIEAMHQLQGKIKI